MDDFTSKEVKYFWRYKNFDALATCAVVNTDATRIAGIGFMEGPKEFQTIHIFDGSDAVTIFDTLDIVPEMEAWICLEVSVEDDVLFIGGASSSDFNTSEAYILALTFNESADVIKVQNFPKETKLRVINSLRRHPEGNILFAGCKGYLAVLFWYEGEFILINRIKNIIDNPITDISILNNAAYTVCDHNQGMVVYFSDEELRNRDPSKRERPHLQYNRSGNKDRDGRDKRSGRGGRDGRRSPPKGKSIVAQKYRRRQPMPPKYSHYFRDYNISAIDLHNSNLRINYSPVPSSSGFPR